MFMQKSATPPSAAPGIFKRLASLLYEILLLIAVLFIASFLFLGLTHDAASPAMRPIFQVYLIVVASLYFLWFWSHGGQTLAMKTWRLRIVSAGGGPVGWHLAFRRLAFGWLNVLLFGLGYVWALFDADRQFLHDRLAGTRIMQTPPPEKKK